MLLGDGDDAGIDLRCNSLGRTHSWAPGQAASFDPYLMAPAGDSTRALCTDGLPRFYTILYMLQSNMRLACLEREST